MLLGRADKLSTMFLKNPGSSGIFPHSLSLFFPDLSASELFILYGPLQASAWAAGKPYMFVNQGKMFFLGNEKPQEQAPGKV